MKNEKKLLGYCGLYCGRCMGYTEVIAKAANNLKKVVEKYKFDQTAKNVFPKELKEYDKFYKVLSFMTGLKCPGKCRTGDDTFSTCEIRRCCKGKRYYACYECDIFQTCDKLKSFMGGIHYNSCIKNLKAINKMGLDDWIKSGKKVWYWD